MNGAWIERLRPAAIVAMLTLCPTNGARAEPPPNASRQTAPRIEWIADLEMEGDLDRGLRFAFQVENELWVANVRRDDPRAPGYRMRVRTASGELIERPVRPSRAFRGTIEGRPDVAVVGGIVEDGILAMVALDDCASDGFFLQPASASSDAVATEPPGTRHLVHRPSTVEAFGACATDPRTTDFMRRVGEVVPDGRLRIAELGVDVDRAFLAAHGSPEAVEDHVLAILALVNLQYERQVDVTHRVTELIVRESDDPYSSTNAAERLCEMTVDWTTTLADVPRDLALLFSGVILDEYAYGIGNPGSVCRDTDACDGTAAFAIATTDRIFHLSDKANLVAHELGHVWGASHCSCPQHTMNEIFVFGSLGFSEETIDVIRSFAATLGCLACHGDLDGDAVVDARDLGILLANWGTDGPGADLAVPTDDLDAADLAVLLGAWGSCGTGG